MKLPESLIEQVRLRSDIVEIIGESVQLKKSGRSYVGLCPFHADRKPSMNVSPDLQIFKCFSCGKGGNIFTFMTDFHRLTFLEAVKSLAARTGIALPDEDKPDSGEYNRTDAAYKTLAAAAKFYATTLATPEGKVALKYFQKRGFQQKLIEEFALGYAPDSWTSLLMELSKQGYSESAMEDAGLILRRDEGKPYDRFRARALFAIHDVSGRVLGFGARQMKDDGQAKYINSPQSLVYDKSKVLYGLFQAKQAIRSQEYAILVEGYADALTLHQAGFRNTIASSGTALTKDQLQLLGRYCKKLYIAYDGDSAGINATERGLEIAIEEGFEVHIVCLPSGEDPDSFVKINGADAFRIYLRDAESFLDFKIALMKKQNILESASGKAEAIRTLVQTIAKVPDVLQHDFLMSRVADSLRLSEAQLHKIYDELTKARKANSTKHTRTSQTIEPQRNNTQEQTVVPQSENSTAIIPTNTIKTLKQPLLPEEKEVLRIALTVPNALRYMTQQLNVVSSQFVTESAQRVFALAETAFNTGASDIFHALNAQKIPDDDLQLIMEIAIRREMPSEKWADFKVDVPTENARRVLTDALLKIQIRSIEREMNAIQSQMKTASGELPNQLLMRLMEITTEKKNIADKLSN
jgi:DNA primase